MTQLQYGYDGDARYNLYYRHTGKVTFVGVLLAGLAGLALGAIAAGLYAYGDVYIPIIYANLALCFGFGAGVGIGCAYIMRWGKVRNVPVTLAIVSVVTAASYYICWAVWIYAVLQRSETMAGKVSLATLLIDPRLLYQIAAAINGVGTWAMSSTDKTNVKGVFLLIVWIGEAAIIFGTAIWTALRFASDLPFCEACNQWCGKGRSIGRVGATTADQLRPRLEQHDFQCLRELSLQARPHLHTDLIHHHCPTCDSLHTLTATRVKITTNKNGRQNTRRKVLVDKLLMTKEQIRMAAIASKGQAIPPPLTAPTAKIAPG